MATVDSRGTCVECGGITYESFSTHTMLEHALCLRCGSTFEEVLNEDENRVDLVTTKRYGCIYVSEKEGIGSSISSFPYKPEAEEIESLLEQFKSDSNIDENNSYLVLEKEGNWVKVTANGTSPSPFVGDDMF